MKKTSIHFEACNIVKSEIHNSRIQELDYIFPELSQNNESTYLCAQNLRERHKDCVKLYEEKVGQKMQVKTIPIREGVVVIDEKTTMNDLKLLAEAITAELGWECLQIHIHRDEGYVLSGDNKGGSEVAKLNLHAHMVFDCQDKNTGKMFRNTKNQMSKVQDLCADILQMERGQKSDRRHLKSLEFKIKVQEERLEKIRAEYQKLSADNEVLSVKNKQLFKDNNFFLDNLEEYFQETANLLEKHEKIHQMLLSEAEEYVKKIQKNQAKGDDLKEFQKEKERNYRLKR